ncbi:hypothetical protein [Anabaena sp. CCY 0017]|uniref:hypothetical protein n=1 Tax=Anabaena sp. CCY 0017 TaxID=3103866 RepID=UPI0039C63A8C
MASIVKSSQDIVFFGRQKDIKLAILQAMANQRTIWNKDVGQIMGLPVADVQRPRRQERILNIIFKSKEKPPWKVRGENPTAASYHIPNCKKGLTWEQVRRAAAPFTWGEYRATATMSSGRQMAVYGATKEEAVKVVRLLATLSVDKITKLRVSDDVQVDPDKIKLPTRYYPCYATLISEPTDLAGKPRQGKKAYKKTRRRLDLYREPDDKTPLG